MRIIINRSWTLLCRTATYCTRAGQVGNMSEPDTLLMIYPRPKLGAPNLSPFGLKLETFLRMAKIEYKPVFGRKLSPQGKTPWITYKGKAVSDSALIIEFYKKELGIDLEKNLTDEQKATARALTTMVEDNMYWITCRLIWDREDSTWLDKAVGLPGFVTWLLRRRLKSNTNVQGMGRHTREDVIHFLDQNMKSLSVILGNKKFLMGDEVTDVDAAVFGQLSSHVLMEPESVPHKMITQTYPNLWSYCERIRETFWPDWDECIDEAKK